jgi:hypothetical protein
VTTAVTSRTPATTPTDWVSPIHPETSPRRLTGVRSGTTAVSPACRVFSPAWATHHQTARPVTVCWDGSVASPASAITEPRTIHVCRRPVRSVVASESAPAIGPASTATSAPRPVTTPSAVVLPDPAMSSTWLGSSTCSGPK